MQQKNIWIFLGTFVAAIGIASIFFIPHLSFSFPSFPQINKIFAWGNKNEAQEKTLSPDIIIKYAQSDSAASVGPKNARVVVVEFLDFQCPFCKAAHPTLMRLIKDYRDAPVRFEFRHFPITSLHNQALPAANASLCANEQGKFLTFYDMAYSRQEEISPAGLATFAKDLDVNLASFNACVAEKRYEPFIQRDVDDALALAVEGTPTWFVNGTRLVGALEYETFKKAIDSALGH